MALKILILVLLACVVASLFSSFVFLFKDVDVPESRRALYALGIRIAFAAALMLTIFYGLYTGQLGLNAPWHGV
ncbi:MAG: DUF2909 domain-containing protein [Gammaproteobacteria bacterium]|nr:DUF2909 domain-containing protein [Gammaproteobacteria bacterium]MCY4200839.1 DUF2909 domain-containing protein [Gammaproteobacteria bacterium]MCY4276272.1 DUF2909 domain-containing protein [Gammaproteobacteria bacterium]MCY4322662.1 DUF2909 domain-containing protein [Gammaproteobacteria bacterium]